MFDVLELWPRAMGLAKETRTAVRADARDEVICANYVPASAKAKLPVPFVRASDPRDDIGHRQSVPGPNRKGKISNSKNFEERKMKSGSAQWIWTRHSSTGAECGGGRCRCLLRAVYQV